MEKIIDELMQEIKKNLDDNIKLKNQTQKKIDINLGAISALNELKERSNAKKSNKQKDTTNKKAEKEQHRPESVGDEHKNT